jgi:hypothetical protein
VTPKDGGTEGDAGFFFSGLSNGRTEEGIFFSPFSNGRTRVMLLMRQFLHLWFFLKASDRKKRKKKKDTKPINNLNVSLPSSLPASTSGFRVQPPTSV